MTRNLTVMFYEFLAAWLVLAVYMFSLFFRERTRISRIVAVKVWWVMLSLAIKKPCLLVGGSDSSAVDAVSIPADVALVQRL